MEAICVTAFILAFFFSLPKKKDPPPKSVEQELGEALGKYLAKGIKINVEVIGSKEDKPL
jgi:predicted hydrocarbon binding protein